MSLKIVTDSTADLPPELAQEMDITVVPLTVQFREKSYRDGIEINSEEFFVRLAQSASLPTTAQPPAAAFQEVYERLSQDGSEILSIHISGKLSGTMNSARLAAQDLEGKVQVHLVDSGLASMSVGMVSLEAARAVKRGAQTTEVLDIVSHALAKSHLLICVDTLEYLQRGGRIGRASAFLGSILSVKPLITVKDGEVRPLERVRTRSRAIERLFDWAASFKDAAEIAVMYATTPADAKILADRLAELFPGVTIHLARIGPVIGTHIGPGAVGVMVREK
ncbi:MAG: DegV family protein [Dehalococcoidia bacterium]|nr:DegV family protein [Dehalococcoidia bacterium]